MDYSQIANAVQSNQQGGGGSALYSFDAASEAHATGTIGGFNFAPNNGSNQTVLLVGMFAVMIVMVLAKGRK